MVDVIISEDHLRQALANYLREFNYKPDLVEFYIGDYNYNIETRMLSAKVYFTEEE